ncbi:MAG: DNA polymerase III subunit gamma/tau [Pseudomonadota bacterium]
MSEQETSQQAYRVLARKYRPQNFDDLIGQEPMVQTLSNAFRTGRIAQAYMLTGVRGVGKTTTARILARALNFKNETADQPTIDLSQDGEHCQAIIEGRHMDVIEMDAASHTGIDAMRDLIESAQYRPATARYKVYIVDEVHMLSGSAFNALLKTLEEPPEHVKFIFATTEIRKVPVTVLSRCQRFDLRRIEAGTLTAHLASICDKENVKAEEDALSMIARAADGSVRDSLSMLDQAIAHGSQTDGAMITAETMRSMLGLSDRARIVDLFEHVMRGDIASALGELKSQYNTGAEPSVVLTDLADFVHLVTRLKYVPDTENDRALSEIERTRGKEFADKLSVRILGRAWQMLLKGMSEVASADRPLAVAEMVLVRMTHASSLPTPDELVKEGNGSVTGRDAALNAPAQDNAPVTAPMPMASSPQPSGQPVMSADNAGGPALAMKQPQPVAEVAQNNIEPPKQFRTVSTFEELIFLVEDKRDLALKTAIKRHIRLVSFADGRIEMNLVENPSREFLPMLGKRLEEWTGKRWMLSVSKEDGAPTLAELERAENEARLDDAKSDPAVEAIMKQFPGAKIVDIRIREEETELVPQAPDGDDSLDEFFE